MDDLLLTGRQLSPVEATTGRAVAGSGAGWRRFNTATVERFENQGECVAFVYMTEYRRLALKFASLA